MFLTPLSILSILLLILIHISHALALAHSRPSKDIDVSFETRAYWMRFANSKLVELATPCPFAPFSTVIVNHSDVSEGPHGKVVCYSVNAVHGTGNPTLHGEIAAINNCSKILTDPEGEYKLTAHEALGAWEHLSLYTNAEPCPMCASAIRWSHLKECIYGTSIKTLIQKGWSQIDLSSEELFGRAWRLDGKAKLIKEVLANETQVLFGWQFDQKAVCPDGCVRGDWEGKSSCRPVKGEERSEL